MKFYAYIAIAAAIAIGCCRAEIEAQDLSSSKIVRVEGNAVGVPWLDLVKALRPNLDLSRIQMTSSDWVIPWQAFQVRVSDASDGYDKAIKIVVDASGRPQSLDIDVEALANYASEWKQEFAEWRASEGGKSAYRLEQAPSSNRDLENTQQRILVIAGYQSQRDEALTVARYLQESTLRPAEILAYPSDGSVNVSARKLAELLNARFQNTPAIEWTIVGHSMGAVIGRAAIELHHARGAKRLIQIFPPNHGSVLAEIAEPLDGVMIAKSQLMRIFASLDGSSNDTVGKAIAPAAMLTWMSQGFGLASHDLCPNSDFLRTLNRCKRASSVDYTVLVGTDGPLHPLVSTAILLSGPALEEQLANRGDMVEVRKAWKWIERIVVDGQLVQGQGDGVVSAVSARLDGVSDTINLPCNHVAWSAVETEAGQRVMKEVIKRINATR